MLRTAFSRIRVSADRSRLGLACTRVVNKRIDYRYKSDHLRNRLISENVNVPTAALSTLTTWKRLFRFISPKYRKSFLLLLLCAVGVAVMEGAVAAFIKPFVDSLGESHPKDTATPQSTPEPGDTVPDSTSKVTGPVLHFGVVAMAMFAMYMTKSLFKAGQTYIVRSTCARVVADIRADAHNRLLHQNARYFREHKPATLISILTNDLSVLQSALKSTFGDAVTSPLIIISLMSLAVYRNPTMSLLVCMVMPISAYFVHVVGRKIKKNVAKSQDDMSVLNGKLFEVFSSMPFVTSYALQNLVEKRFNSTHSELLKHQVKIAKYEALMSPAAEISTALAAASAIMLGGYQVATGTTTPGELLSFLTALAMIYKPIKNVLALNSELQTTTATAQRVFKLIDTMACQPQHTLSSADLPKISPSALPGVEFRGVSFTYPDGTKPTLQDITFEVRPGQLVVIVGGAGSGKSTLLSLLNRLNEITTGSILIDGVDLRAIPKEQLTQYMAVVHQTPYIWNDSIANNIRLGKHDATDDEIIEILNRCHCHFVHDLPNGIHTIIGHPTQRYYSSGKKSKVVSDTAVSTNLSGGQLQLLCIARAMLTRAPILLLDEITSNLDNESEELINQSLKALKGTSTMLLITHRLKITQLADAIITIKNGRIQEHSHGHFVEDSSQY